MSFPIDSQDEMGRLGVLHLKRLWARVTRRSRNKHSNDWLFDRILIDGLGLAQEETLQYLGTRTPPYEEFEAWILERNGGYIDPLRIEHINAAISGAVYSDELKAKFLEIEEADPVFSFEDLRFWQEQGYAILRNAVSVEDCRLTEAAISQFLSIDPGDCDTWYQPSDHGIMKQFFHHPALAANRSSPRVHKAFAQIWGTADLWMTVDRISFNPPERRDWIFPGPYLHWDTTLAQPIPFGVSGMIYLTDTEETQGAFTCVPGFHRRIDEWLNNLSPDVDPRREDLESLGAKPIAGAAGDLIIWHKALPHGSRPNRAARPRIVQYLSMHPTKREHNPIWK
jgi:hypothetical protein